MRLERSERLAGERNRRKGIVKTQSFVVVAHVLAGCGGVPRVPDKVLRPILATILVIVGVRMLRA